MAETRKTANTEKKDIVLLHSGERIVLKDALECFVNEYTGEIDPNRRVLDKRVREAWFRSVYPEARIEAKVEVTSCLDRLVRSGLNLSALPLDEAVLNKLAALDNGGRQCLATVRIYDGDKVIAEEHSLRVRYAVSDAKPFEYYTEAAINSAKNRALIDLGFVIAEEYVSESTPEEEPKPEQSAEPPKKRGRKKKEQELDEFSEMLDETPEPAKQQTNPIVKPEPEFTYDKKTPVEEIMKHMSEKEARAYVIKGSGAFAGRTVGELVETDPGRAEWFGYSGKYAFDNILIAACRILINKEA